MRYACLALMLFLIACSEPSRSQEPVLILPEPDMPKEEDMSPTDTSPPVDMPREDMTPSVPRAIDVCDTLGLPRAPFPTASTETASLGSQANPFVVSTHRGTWSLKDHWTGCDTYVFLNHQGNVGSQLWASDLTQMLRNSAKNTHYFFSTYEGGLGAYSITSAMQAKIDNTLIALLPKNSAHWKHRVHILSKPTRELDAGAGDLPRALPWALHAFSIDRFGRYDLGGSLAKISGQGFVSELPMAAYLSHYYNFTHKQAQEIDAQTDVTTVPLFQATPITKEQNHHVHTATFPDAATMAGFDTLELDIQASCGPTPTDCGEWDYEAFLQWCSDTDCTTHHEIALWITPYSRPGTRRWIVDATPFLPLLKDGGTQHIRFGMLWNMNPNTMDVTFRLRNMGTPKPIATLPAFKGGNFDASYNERDPLTFTPPANASRVELVTLLTGHGQEAGNNCAEWCNHVHHFEVNGTQMITKDHEGEAGTPLGCAERAGEGVVPGQYGNWAPGRAAWCPGLAVQPWRVDITDAVTPGQENTITYRGSFRGGEPQGGRIRMSSYIVSYE